MKKWVLILVVMVFAAGAASAQGCAVCSRTATGLNDKGARGLNGGILYLAAIPLTILGSLGFVWWRYNRGEI